MILLTIIIPAYNAEPFIDELLATLTAQLDEKKKDIEVLVIDDGSRKPFKTFYPFVRIIRKNNGGVSTARNRGLDEAKGKYIAFIDADDLVAPDYIKQIREKLKEEPDAVYLSWETFGSGWKYKCHLKDGDEFPSFNLCVWNRVYKKDAIGQTRFNIKKLVAEDAEFIREVKTDKIAYIQKPVYFYRTDPHDSLTQRIAKGKIDMRRIVYHFEHVTKDMAWLIEEFEKEYNDSEIILLTRQNDLPELSKFALIMAPAKTYGTELRGEPTSLYLQIPRPIRTQVVVYIGNTMQIGGVETWIYNFCANLYKLYDIMVCYKDRMWPEQIAKLSEIVMVHKLGTAPVFCDSFLNMRITDEIPEQIQAKQILQLCHTCKMKDWKIQKNYDRLIYVSETASKTFEEPGEVIHNLTVRQKETTPLFLITASRFTFEKGLNRMYSLANTFKSAGIDILWLVFTNAEIEENNGIKRMPPTTNMRAWIKKADYLVQLSDVEAFCYSIVEALEEGTPVLTTPLEVLKELKFKDKQDGYILPFNMQGIDARQIAERIPTPKFKNDNEKIIKQWREVLGDTQPEQRYNTDKPFIKVKALENYTDLELGRYVREGEVLTIRRERARMWMALGKVEYISEGENE